mmetsp:Transcript_100370/g.259664  ORF Transcript_100370/g.259664 Transcript_100370/m.259664 type:complete len:235 (+) Transcript_100370:17-721(+)
MQPRRAMRTAHRTRAASAILIVPLALATLLAASSLLDGLGLGVQGWGFAAAVDHGPGGVGTAVPHRFRTSLALAVAAPEEDLRPRMSTRLAAAAGEGPEAGSEAPHVLLVISDPNPYLSAGTQAAIRHSATLAVDRGRVTALVLPAGNVTSAEAAASTQQGTVRWWLLECGLEEPQFDELLPAGDSAPEAAVADAADDLDSASIVIAADAVAGRRLDTALLATFIGCPLVIVPE